MIPRSYLFVPGDRPDRFDKALATGAEIVVIDLEDAVLPKRKAGAREAVRNWLRMGGRAAVRINGIGMEWHEEDVVLLATPGVVAAGLFGFTLSYDEFARTSLLSGEFNTLPLDINASMTQRIRPTLFALGTATTVFSLSLIALFVAVYMFLYRRSR